MRQPKPITRKYSELLDNIENGNYQIPKFQRDFVWSIDKSALLIDSILKSYPIGTFILWKTKERLKSLKQIGNSELICFNEDTDYVHYVLDGQQRITSLYLAIKGINQYKEIYIDLSKIQYNEKNKAIEINTEDIVCTQENNGSSISVYRLINESQVDLLEDYEKIEIKKIDILQKLINNYEFSTIEIENTEFENIVDIFTRINTSGKSLSLFEIMNAKVYDENINFDLENEYNDLRDDLADADFETVIDNRVLLLQLVSAVVHQDVKRKSILSISKEDFIKVWPDVKKSLKMAIDKIRRQLFIPVSNLLPYNALIVCFSYFYYINDFKEPDHSQTQNLIKFFYRATFGNRYSQSADTKISKDLSTIKSIRDNARIDFEKTLPLDLEFTKEDLLKKFLIKIEFSTGNAVCRGILCLMASQSPLSFKDNSKIIIDNSWLSRSNSKKLPSFFPKEISNRQ